MKTIQKKLNPKSACSPFSAGLLSENRQDNKQKHFYTHVCYSESSSKNASNFNPDTQTKLNKGLICKHVLY